MASKKSKRKASERIDIEGLENVLREDLKGKHIQPFWNETSKTISGVLDTENKTYDVLPSPVLEPNTLSECKINLSSPNLPPVVMGYPKDEANTVSKKLKLKVTRTQDTFFKQCFGAHRYIYNKALDDYNTHYKTKKVSAIDIRKRILKNDRTLPKDDEEAWLKEIPKDTRDEAIRCLIKNVKVCQSNLKNGNITHFEMKYLRKRESNDIFHISSKALSLGNNKLRLFPTRLKEELRVVNRSRRWLNNHSSLIFGSKVSSKTGEAYGGKNTLLHNASITRLKDGSYYLIVCYKKSKSNSLCNNVIDDVVALDPGVRTFQTFFSERSYGKIGNGFYESRIKKINQKIDYLTSVASTLKSNNRKNLMRVCNKLRIKAKNITLDLHRKTASFLTNNYKTILIPKFEVKNMTQVKNRTITKSTTRSMLGLNHFSFRQRLMNLQIPGRCKVIEVSEAYTSKTCGKCGVLNTKLGNDTRFKCPVNECGYECDRDVNGARNILLRCLSKIL